MTTKRLAPINNLLTQHRAAIGQELLTEVMLAWNQHYPGLVSEEELRKHAGHLLDALLIAFAEVFDDTPRVIATDGAFAATARQLSARRAKAGFKTAETAQYALALKNVLTGRLVSELSQSPFNLDACLKAVDGMMDRFSLLTFEAYVEARESIIAQRSLSPMALSPPVIRLWDQVLMLPLIGVIDTLRARQFTESLLEAITRYEASVTIIDVTGVPVFDTSVAQHIMKTVDAAQLLGTRIIMTGISPEGAQTLTKLGISFAKVISRATLRAGIAEALQMIGKRVVAVSGAGK